MPYSTLNSLFCCRDKEHFYKYLNLNLKNRYFKYRCLKVKKQLHPKPYSTLNLLFCYRAKADFYEYLDVVKSALDTVEPGCSDLVKDALK